LKGAISNSGGVALPADAPHTVLPAIAKDIPKLPPESWPAFDPTKPDTDFQLQQAVKVLRAMPVKQAAN
jgi:carboxyl-terminal processing protease